MFPLLTGLSIFCLAAPNNATVTRVFGGSNGNEGLGLLSLCFDWQVQLTVQIHMLIFGIELWSSTSRVMLVTRWLFH
jgi:hypothetical protein